MDASVSFLGVAEDASRNHGHLNLVGEPSVTPGGVEFVADATQYVTIPATNYAADASFTISRASTPPTLAALPCLLASAQSLK